jgi:hypothetical protein
MNDLTQDFGLLRRELRDARAVVAAIDHKLSRLIVPETPQRPAGLCARLATCELLARMERTSVDAIAKMHFSNDLDLAQMIGLRNATAPAMTTVSGWAAELVGIFVQDLTDRMLPLSVFSQLRPRGIAYTHVNGGIIRAPSHQSTPSGGFFGEGQPISVSDLLILSLALLPKKAASIVAVTRELLRSSPMNVEASLQAILGEDVSLAIDIMLCDATVADDVRPAGLRAGIAALPSASSGTPTERVVADVRALVAAISPAARPTLIVASPEAVSLASVLPAMPAIAAPRLAAGTVICVDAADFASVLGPPDFSVRENPVIHEATPALPISAPGSPPTIAAPVRSLWQTVASGLRTIVDIDWTLRRTGAVSWMTGVSW